LANNKKNISKKRKEESDQNEDSENEEASDIEIIKQIPISNNNTSSYSKMLQSSHLDINNLPDDPLSKTKTSSSKK